jgi:hypothetical protein
MVLIDITGRAWRELNFKGFVFIGTAAVAADANKIVIVTGAGAYGVTATPQVARIGIGAAAHATDVLTVVGKSTFSDTIIASSTVQATGFLVGATAGIDATVALAKLTWGGANGSVTVVKGVVTAYTAPT